MGEAPRTPLLTPLQTGWTSACHSPPTIQFCFVIQGQHLTLCQLLGWV